MVNRGEVWWAELSDPVGSEAGYKRPIVVIQADSFNLSRINTVICIVITSNLKLAEAPGNLFLSARSTGLPKNSVLNVSQIITIDKSFLTEKIGDLSSKQLLKLNDSLKMILEIK